MPGTRDKRPSEFGGTPGRIAGGEHTLSSEEEARLMRATEPTDPNDDVNAALIRERRMEGRA